MPRTFDTHLNCGVLGEALPAVVDLEYFPETDLDNEYIDILFVMVRIQFNSTTDYKMVHVLDNLTEAEKSNIEEKYLGQLHRVEETE